MLRPSALALAVCTAATPLAAQPDGCLENLSTRGNAITGRTFTTFLDLPALNGEAAFELLRADLQSRERLKVTVAAPDQGSIRGEERPEGAARDVPFVFEVRDLAGGGTRVSKTSRLPAGMLAAARSWAVDACAMIQGLTSATPQQRDVASSSSPASLPPGTRVIHAGAGGSARLGYGELVRGSVADPEQIVKIELHGLTSGDTVLVLARDPDSTHDRYGWVHPLLRVRLRDVGRGRTVEPNIDGQYVVGAGPYEMRIELEPAVGRVGQVVFDARVARVTNAPDHLGGRVALGDTIRGEWIDYVHDLDEFEFEAPANAEIQVYSGADGEREYETRPSHRIYRRGPAGGLLPLDSDGTVYSVPSAGTYVLRVGYISGDFATMGTSSFQGPYWFRLRLRD